jgi:hypothetical protein
MINDLTTFAKLMRALGQNMTPADLSKMHGGTITCFILHLKIARARNARFAAL